MDVAVIIPLYNGAPWIERTLASVFSQTRLPAEVVVVDDGSRDGSPEIVQRFRKARLLRNPEKGALSARDMGCAHTQAPLISFLDQDDYWAASHIERLSSVLEKESSAVAAAAREKPISKDGLRPAFGIRAPLSICNLNIWKNFPFGTLSSPSQVLMRRKDCTKCGGWRGQTNLMGDVELTHRLAMRGKFLLSDAVTVARNVHSRSFSGNLRRRNLITYMNALCECAARLGELRLKHYPEDREWIAQRQAVAHCMRRIIQRLVKDDSAEIKKELMNLTSRLDSESQDFRNVAWSNLIWFLEPVASSYEGFSLLHNLLMNENGTKKPYIRRFRDLLLQQRWQMFILLFLARPWEAKRFQWLVRRLRKAISQ